MANESEELLRLWQSRPAGRAVLATVVHVEGSAYRRPGSRLLTVEHGPCVGTISGGCLERDLLSKAFFLTENGPTTIDYDTRDGDMGDFNLGCRGLIRVLLQPAGHSAALTALRRVMEEGRPQVLMTVHGVVGESCVSVGQQFIANAEDTTNISWLTDALATDTIAVASEGKPRSRRVRRGAAHVDVLIERLDPPQSVVIFGAGDDVVPVVNIAADAGCHVTVVSRRPGQAGDERFVQAKRRLDLQPDQVESAKLIDDRSAVLLMTHDFDADSALLPVLLRSPARYIGLLGPKARTARLLTELHAKGVRLTPADLLRLRTPVGLDIGGSTPQEIALSVVSEIIATKNHRPGTPLRDLVGGIHESVDQAVIDAAL